ncbi:MAG: CPBP family intramembrane metalloprotease [Candidatus Omnitrophica bacterium]|nr:CPBP family intramembrane metalloprotease [Candidatus Omnitrophota bacterium]
MLKSVRLFFRNEPRYFWAVCAILLFHGYFLLGAESFLVKESGDARTNAVLETIESKWENVSDRQGFFLDFEKKDPVTALLFRGVTTLFLVAVMVGMVLNAFYFSRGSVRAAFNGTLDPPGNGSWPFSVLAKVVILSMLWGIFLSLVMAVFRAIFPRAMPDDLYTVLHTISLHIVSLYYIVQFLAAGGSSWRDLGIRIPARGDIFREVKAGFLGYVGVLPFFTLTVFLLLVIADLTRYQPPPHPLVNVFLEKERMPFLFGTSLLLGAVIGPVFEEIFFRGFCYPILRNRWGKFWAAVLSAACFAGIHHSGFVFWPIFVLGVALAYLYEKRRSLIASITLHVAHNTLFIVYFFLVQRILEDMP